MEVRSNGFIGEFRKRRKRSLDLSVENTAETKSEELPPQYKVRGNTSRTLFVTALQGLVAFVLHS